MKKLNLGGINTTTSTSSKPEHPVITVSGDMAELLKQFTEVAPRFKVRENQKKTINEQLAPMIRGKFFETFEGRAATSSTLITQVNGMTVKLITKKAYSQKLTSEQILLGAVGPEIASSFHEATIIKLDLDKCPEDKQESFINGVVALAQTLGVTECVSAKQCIQPIPGFHEDRCRLLTPDQNLALDQVLPITAYPQL